MSTSNYSFIRAEYLSHNILWQILSYIRLAFTVNTIMQSYNVVFVNREIGEFVFSDHTLHIHLHLRSFTRILVTIFLVNFKSKIQTIIPHTQS